MSIEKGFIWINDAEAAAVVPPEGHIVYARDTDAHLASDGTVLTAMGGGGSFNTEDAQDAVGAMIDTSLTYVDTTPLLKVTELSGDVTSTGANVTTIVNDAVTDAKLRNSAGLSVVGRSANSTGDVADITGATVGHVLQVGAGPVLSWAYHRRPSVDNPPATTHAYSDEFDGTTLDGKWTGISGATTNPIASGTVARLSSLTTPIYDTASSPSYIMFQSDNSTPQTFGIQETVVLGTNATIFVKMFADNRAFNSATEGGIYFQIFNAGDTNEFVSMGLGNAAGAGQTTKAILSNNGALTLNTTGATRTEGNPLIESLFCIMKSSDTYYFFSGTEGTPILTLIGSATKTGVTTLNRLKFECYTANETPSTMYGIDFIRWYDSLESNLVNP